MQQWMAQSTRRYLAPRLFHSPQNCFILNFILCSQRLCARMGYCAFVVLAFLFSPQETFSQAQTNLPIVTASGRQLVSTLIAPQSEGAVVMWRDERTNARPVLYAQRLNQFWHPVWPANGIAISHDNSRVVAYSSAIAAGANGDVIVAWQSEANDDGDVYAQRISSAGERLWGEEGITVYRGSREQGTPLVVSDNEGGAFVIWQDQRSGGQGIYAQRLSSSGAKLWAETGVSLARLRRDQVLGDAAATPDGGFVAIWTDEDSNPRRVYVQRVNAAGNTQWGEGRAVATTIYHQSAPRLAVTPGAGQDFSVKAAWIERRLLGALNVYVQNLNAAGATLWGDGILAGRGSGEQSAIQLLAASEGSLLLGWQDGRNDQADIYGQRIDASGRLLWGAEGVAVARYTRSQTSPRLAPDGQEGFICVWLDDRSGENLAAQRITKEGQPAWAGDGVPLKLRNGDVTQPAILAAANGGALVSWTDTRNNNEDIYAQPVTAAGVLENIAPLITSTPVTEARVGNVYEYRVAATDYDSDLTPALQLQTAPAWLALNAENNTLSGTPAASDVGERTVTVLAIDQNNGSFAQTYQLRVIADPEAPRIISTPDTTAREDEKYSYQIQVAGAGDDRNLTYDLKTNAAWLTLSAQGELSGLPLNEHVGTYDVTLTVTTPQNKSDQQAFKLRVQNTNDAPLLTSGPPPRATEGVAYQFRFEAKDPDAGDVLQFSAPLKPAWLQLAATGEISGTPSRAHLADTVITIVVADLAGAQDRKTYAIPINTINQPPRITSTPPTTATEDTPWQYQIVASDPDPNETLSYAVLAAPNWLTFDTTLGLLRGTPFNEHVGDHAVQVQVQDRAGAKDQQSFSVRVVNTNDLPVFSSRPDTVALVDSLYRYLASAQDVDVNDRVQIFPVALPAWLAWEAASNMLRGTPALRDTGETFVTLRAQDLFGGVATQTFRIKVFSLSAPDNAAPSAPQNLIIIPGIWSRTAQFTARWQNPFDPSQISGAYYKIGAAPANNTDGTMISAADLTEFKLQATAEGRIPVYVWLVDGRGNVDYRTAARADYLYDITPPLAASALRITTENGSSWTRGDSITFLWQPATDLLSGVASYEFRLNSEAVVKLPGTATSFVRRSPLEEGNHRWQLTALDSAGNRSAVMFSPFGVDRAAPVLTLTAIDTAQAGQPLLLRANANDGLSGIAILRVWHRTAGNASFVSQSMTLSAGEFTATITGGAVRAPGFEYFIDAADSAGNLAMSVPAGSLPWHAVVVRSTQVAAPNTTRRGYYQLISAPYHLEAPAADAIFTDDFGAYDPMRWRIFTYNETQGNVEFGKQDFRNLEAGKGYWLITSTPLNYTIGASHSITTGKDFALTLQPGWNLIASPFDFPIDWNAAQKPVGIEPQLWAFDGRQYLAQNGVMQPWQGYYVYNLTTQPQTVLLPPQASSRLAKTVAPLPASEAVTWQLQLRVRDGEFADEQNWLGLTTQAAPEWDELELSEPPAAMGNFVSLHFPRKNWKEFPGNFATDFRPPSQELQSWPFEVHSSEEGKTIQLSFAGELLADWQFVLCDAQSNPLLVLDPQREDNSYTFRSGKRSRAFVLLAAPRAEMDASGILTQARPTAFALAPGYPNPVRLQTGQNALSVIRFSLPVATPVTLRIFDVLGRNVRTLAVAQAFNLGHHEIIWDGRDNLGVEVAAGIYLYRLETPQFTATQKLIMIK